MSLNILNRPQAQLDVYAYACHVQYMHFELRVTRKLPNLSKICCVCKL